MYEHKKQPLLPAKKFYHRVLNSILLACSILAICLVIGVFGFHFISGATYIDSFHNASMLLSGMGPVIVITNIGVILAPLVHRVYHRLHLEEDNATS